ncbi:nucleoid-associated protein [Desulfogranum marinum]|uniref:nucleoid-associated protein n=1 Tax=Desulfogranum marinum TaxID=453220 RepID=UPI0029C99439|nr:nucleoid-associated protein [Desulfogranum marinum]
MPDLIVNNVIVHELVKEQHQAIQQSNYRDAVLDTGNEVVEKLIADIIGMYGTRGNSANFGTFREDEGRGEFPDKFLEYAAIQSPNDQQFIHISKKAMVSLYQKAEGKTASSGGYILFVDYSNRGNRFFLVSMIKQKDGIRFNEELEPVSLIELDLRRLHQAARVNFSRLTAWSAAGVDDRQELTYLSFISPQSNKDVAGYFIESLGCTPGTSSSKATSNVVKECYNYFRNSDVLKPKAREFKEKVIHYLSGKQAAGEAAKISEIENLSRAYFPAEEDGQSDGYAYELAEKLNSEEASIPREFSVSKKSLDKFKQIVAKSDNWEIKFEMSALGENESAEIYYNRESRKLVINELTNSIVSDIEKELSSRS